MACGRRIPRTFRKGGAGLNRAGGMPFAKVARSGQIDHRRTPALSASARDQVGPKRPIIYTGMPPN